MATYVPNATQATEPVESRTVESAALEFRTLKDRVNTLADTVVAGDAQDLRVPETSVQPLPSIAGRAGKVLGFDAGGNPAMVSVAGAEDPSLRADLAASGGAAMIGYTPSGTGAVSTTVQQQLRNIQEWTINVKDAPFYAQGDGVTDDTAAFNAAIATGKKVIVPEPSVGYLVNGITVVDNMVIEGEKSGVSAGPLLIVSTNNGCAFLQGATNNFQVDISNLACKAATGVTGASFFKQTDKTKYSAYTRFSKIETYKDLAISYDGLFIFATWDQCRDGYLGTSSLHTAITSKTAAYAQANATNINLARDCQFFGAVGSNACVEVSYGSLFTFENCDFEALSVPVFSGQAAKQVQFLNCWFEGVLADRVVSLAEWPATTAGSNAIFERCIFFVDTPTWVSNTDAYSYVSYRECAFNIVPGTLTLSNNGLAVRVNENNTASGAGAATFFTGMHHDSYSGGKRFLNGATDNSSGAVIQNSGVLSTSGGVTSTYSQAVTTSFVSIATLNFVGGMCFINGYNTSGGAPGAWLVMFVGSSAVVVSSSDTTGTNPTFQKSGNYLQMKTTTGTLAISTSLLV